MLTLARNARSLAPERVSPGLLQALAAEAQALAIVGRQREALEHLRDLQELTGRYSFSEEFGWCPSSIWFTSAWVSAYGGATESAREARDAALAASPSYQNAANVRLQEAISVGKSGGYDEALHLATQIMSDLDPAYRTNMIMHTARRVLDTVPVEKRAALPALGDYRAAVNVPVPA
ncbi:hypothetical protein AB0O34_15130 [Sphaerisporangium sp. NPDC088356]|uniref:hypothetical protein n=1 Tax=Sphaerisporangium sp. NPDC088356 TaxID=3154871 RepID=UPI0034207F2C